MTIFAESFSTGQVIAATGVPNHTLQSWLKRGLVVGPSEAKEDHKIQGGGSPGAHRRFSFYSVMEIAIAKALTDIGSPSVETAFRVAAKFAHFARGSFGWEGGPVEHVRRLPSLPLNHRTGPKRTLLCVSGGTSVVIPWDGKGDVWSAARHALNTPDGFVILEVDRVFDRVVRALGHDPWEVLSEAYPMLSTDGANAPSQEAE